MASVIQFQSIGIVRNGILEAHRDTHWDEIESEISVDEKWRDALDGIAEFSHIWVIFHIDRVPAPTTLRIQPIKQADLPVVGIFSTRSPQRPNPIGIRAVELLAVRENILRVRGLDALDGTPVLDLKPYIARHDAIQDSRVAAWAKKNHQEVSKSKK
ncbi:MAG: tRNA (N6-threonylcarbamoyladenosine(37)-N6)-methyltransferase TrmO [Chloroflexi bacterium]|nr:tRNA (N6-threonylcarbamoyladenosine(37)-N6)-methyltransferase TrmO [Chloroflexota bacterium]